MSQQIAKLGLTKQLLEVGLYDQIIFELSKLQIMNQTVAFLHAFMFKATKNKWLCG